jgi:hypothetical protein
LHLTLADLGEKKIGGAGSSPDLLKVNDPRGTAAGKPARYAGGISNAKAVRAQGLFLRIYLNRRCTLPI